MLTALNQLGRCRAVRGARRTALLPLVAALLAGPAAAAVTDPFPDAGPPTRAAAVALVAGETSLPLGCLTPRIEQLTHSRLGTGPAIRRAVALLQSRSYSGGERTAFAPDGTPVTFTADLSAFDRVSVSDADGDGTPDVVEQAIDGLVRARGLLVDRLGLKPPSGLRAVLVELGAGLEGYLLERSDGATIVLDGSPAREAAVVRRAAIHQYAHAIAAAAGPEVPPHWGEALAAWAVLSLADRPDAVTLALVGSRLDRMGEGLFARDPELAAGNAIWFAFLHEFYGPAAVTLAVRELAQGGSPVDAMHRAIAAVSADDLARAFREFHLWSVLTGPRAGRRHFPFAAVLGGPAFASAADGLPALSVQADPALFSWSAAQVLLTPEPGRGGLGLRVEGEFGANWQADLLLVDERGTVRRLAMDLTAGGWGEKTVPLDDVAEAILLLRNLGSEDGSSRRYTYAAHRELGYPFELSSFEARHGGESVDLDWETTSERELIGFNLLRTREAGGTEVVINPVWIPALGERDVVTSYRFVDRTAEPGVAYLYRVEAITADGFTSVSDALVLRPPAGR